MNEKVQFEKKMKKEKKRSLVGEVEEINNDYSYENYFLFSMVLFSEGTDKDT